VGFAFLSLAIVTGLLWNHSARGHYWTGDAKEWTAVVAWVMYVALISARHRTGWGGRRAAFLGIASFSVVALVWMTMLTGVAGASR
jgi:ABC-type transport system involved in cytochrome c biogenesis permease subunit